MRYFLIIALFSALIVSALYLYLHYKKARKLRVNIENLVSARENSSLIDSCILNLYSADNYSRLYTVTGNKIYFKKFLTDINNISTVVNRLRIDKKDVPDSNSVKFDQLMKEKARTTDGYIKLRLLTDSLIKSSSRINYSLNKYAERNIQPTVKIVHTVTVDTVTPEKPRKKFFGRLFSAISGKQNTPTIPAVIKKDTIITTTTIPVNKAAARNAYKKYYNNLNAVNNKLMANEQRLLTINNNLIEEIIASLKLYKTVEQLYIKDSKTELQVNLANVYSEFKQISALNIIFLVSLVTLVFYNIWKIFRNEQEIIMYSEKAEQYAQSKSRFLAGMSHEIRTPLNSVIGFSEQLAQEHLSETQREQVDAIRTSSEMLLELVNEILDFSKYETGKMNFDSAPFMLCHALEDVAISMNIHAMKKNIILEKDIDVNEILCCEGDRMRLKQVLMNLVGNAIKFTVRGSVTLSAYNVNETEDSVLLKVKIKDTGLGIPKDKLPHIFEEFSQVADAQRATRHKGTGLGLAICKKIIELQGGTISVASQPGKGSTFSFELPLKKCLKVEDAIEIGLSDEQIAELVQDKYVLFAEDNKFNVLLGTTILKKWKIRHDVAYDGHEALQLFKKNNYDLVLTDIQMPEMSGLELTRYIRKHNDAAKAKVPVIALTANVMKEDRDLYLKTGMNEVVLKPFLEKDLIGKTASTIQNNETAERFMA